MLIGGLSMLDSKLLGKRIQRYRRMKSWSAERFAEEIDVSVPYIRELERGAKTPSMKMFVEIANKFEVTADELLCDSVEKDKSMLLNDLAAKLQKCSSEKIKIINVLIDAIIEKL